ncbi:MAG: SigE family RNA polymerase sigma factor [Actinobacteria bacterium]|nr:SigE family RNA polymerase sigma factor [Actinomycetota bacterium]
MAQHADFEQFVAARYAALARTALLLTGSRASAEDLLQEALLKTYVAWSSVRAREAAEAYVRTTMVRLLIRDRKRRWSGEIPHEQLPEDTAYEPDRAGGLAVRTTLAALPTDQRAAIVLRFYADLPESAIAEALGCPAGTVKSRISRGLTALRVSGLLADETLATGAPS